MTNATIEEARQELSDQQNHINGLNDTVRIEFIRRKQICIAAISKIKSISALKVDDLGVHAWKKDDLTRQRKFAIGIVLVLISWNLVFSEIYIIKNYLQLILCMPLALVSYEIFVLEKDFKDSIILKESEIDKCKYDLSCINLSFDIINKPYEEQIVDGEDVRFRIINWEVNLSKQILQVIDIKKIN
jgi:hypothetical protein